MTAAAILIAASAAIPLVLGTLHLVFTFSGERLFPRDASLIERMKEESPRISRQTSVWRASLGFHASHSLGAMLFGFVYLYFAVLAAPFFFASHFLVGLGFAYAATMTWLAKRYWFLRAIPRHGRSDVPLCGGNRSKCGLTLRSSGLARAADRKLKAPRARSLLHRMGLMSGLR